MKEKITIYTNKTCPYCRQVKDKLKESSIEFIEKDTVESKEEWTDIVGLTNNPVTPTIKIGNEFLLPGRDFQNPQNLIDIIPNFKESKYNENRRVLELVKTLNFNIFTAFQRMQQILQQIEDNTKKEKDEHESTS